MKYGNRKFFGEIVSLLLAGLFLSLFSCSGKAKPKDYFPLIDGAVYEYNHGLSKRVVSFYGKEGDYALYEVKNYSNDSLYIMKDQYILTRDKVFWYGFQSADFGQVYFEPPIAMVPNLFDKDSMFSSVTKEVRNLTTGQEIYKLKVIYNFKGMEEITVPAGTFTAIHYRYYISYIGKAPELALMDISGDWWFAKDVGVIKQSATESMLELTRYSKP